jgi:hypothetical protein
LLWCRGLRDCVGISRRAADVILDHEASTTQIWFGIVLVEVAHGDTAARDEICATVSGEYLYITAGSTLDQLASFERGSLWQPSLRRSSLDFESDISTHTVTFLIERTNTAWNFKDFDPSQFLPLLQVLVLHADSTTPFQGCPLNIGEIAGWLKENTEALVRSAVTSTELCYNVGRHRTRSFHLLDKRFKHWPNWWFPQMRANVRAYDGLPVVCEQEILVTIIGRAKEILHASQ